MTGKLTFNAAEVRRVVDHALNAKSFGKGYGGAIGDLVLVHDQGVYLMSNGRPRDEVGGSHGPTSYVAYASGCNPNTDVSWWENARSLVGGDDFAEYLPWAGAIKARLDRGAKSIVIWIGPNQLRLATGRHG